MAKAVREDRAGQGGDPATKRFLELRPDLVLDAAEAAGFAPSGRFSALNSLENRVFSVEVAPDGRAPGGRLVIKFYRPGRWSAEQIAEEHRFLADLAGQDFPVACPLAIAPALSGMAPAHRALGPSLALSEGMHWAVWSAVEGKIPDEFNDVMLSRFGRLLARLHLIGRQGRISARPRLDADSLVRRPLDYLARSGLVHPQVWPRYRAAAEEVAQALEACLAGMPYQRIHGDCHWGNLLQRGEELCFLDFDDSLEGPVVQDLWMMAPAQDAEGQRQQALVLAGYRELAPFDPVWLEALNPLKAGRYIHYAAWIARRWADPSFPRAFPHFGDREYWETEARDLEQLIRQGFLPEQSSWVAQAEEDHSHLTNKDYFWDMED